MTNGFARYFDPFNSNPAFSMDTGPLGGAYGGVTTGSAQPGDPFGPMVYPAGASTTEQDVMPPNAQPVSGTDTSGALSGRPGGPLSGLFQNGVWQPAAAALGGSLLAARGNLGNAMANFGQEAPQLSAAVQQRRALNNWMAAKSKATQEAGPNGDQPVSDATRKQLSDATTNLYQTNPQLAQAYFQYSAFPHQKKLQFNPVTGQALLADDYGNVTDLAGNPIQVGQQPGAATATGAGGGAPDKLNIGSADNPTYVTPVPLNTLIKPEKLPDSPTGETIYRGFDANGQVQFARGPTGKTDPQQMQYQGVADRLQAARDTIAQNMNKTLRPDLPLSLGSSDPFWHSLQNPDDPGWLDAPAQSFMTPEGQKYYGAGEELARAARSIDTARNVTPKTSEQYQHEYLPAYADSPARRQQKLEAIDALIKEVRGMGGGTGATGAAGGAAPQPTQQPQYQEGQTATGLNGQRIVFRAGQWVDTATGRPLQ